MLVYLDTNFLGPWGWLRCPWIIHRGLECPCLTGVICRLQSSLCRLSFPHLWAVSLPFSPWHWRCRRGWCRCLWRDEEICTFGWGWWPGDVSGSRWTCRFFFFLQNCTPRLNEVASCTLSVFPHCNICFSPVLIHPGWGIINGSGEDGADSYLSCGVDQGDVVCQIFHLLYDFSRGTGVAVICTHVDYYYLIWPNIQRVVFDFL